MSRAFVKDDDDRPEPTIVSAEQPYYVTASALAALDDDRRSRAIVIETVAGVVGFGSHVDVIGENGTHVTYTIVNDEDSDPLIGAISVTSPLAVALSGKRVGERARWERPIGDAFVTIAAVS